jgi:putative ABC transport system permease protein
VRLLFWLRYMTRALRRSGRRALFAGVCVVVGVAGLVALQLATLTVQSALTDNIRAANGGDISVVTSDNPVSAADLRIMNRLQRTGRISRWTAVASLHATAVGPAHALIPFDVNVVSVPPYPLGGDPTFVTPSTGHVAALLRRPGDVLITTVLADELGAHVGDRLLVNRIGGTGLHVTVRGILAETSFEHASVMTVERRDLAALSSGPLRYTAIYADTPGNSAQVAAALRQQFPVATVQTVQEALQAAEAEVHDFRQFMLLVGLLALLIAGIGILNAMQSMLAWRRLEIAMLKAMGYRQWALYILFGGEAMLLGLLGGIVGTLLGAVSSKVISDALARALAVQVTFQLDVGTLVGGVALGIGATLVFAILPIVRAAGLRPLELLREGGGVQQLYGLPQTIGLLALVLLLFAVLASAIMGNTVLALELVGGAAGACLLLTGVFSAIVTGISRLGPPASMLVGVAVLALLVLLAAVMVRIEPALVALLVLGAVLWAATVLLPRRRLLPLLMAVRSLGRRRARTSVTLVAFLVGVLAMTITLTVAISLQGQINSALASSSSSNLVVIANPATEGAVLREARHLAGVKDRTQVLIDATTPTAVNGRPTPAILGSGFARRGEARDTDAGLLGGLAGYDLARGQGASTITVRLGRPLRATDAGTDHVLVRTRLLGAPWNLRLGDRVTLHDSGSGMSRTVTVVGFYARSRRRAFGSFFLAPVIGDRTLARDLGKGESQSVITFSIDPNSLTSDAALLQRDVAGILVIDIGDLARVVDTVLGELLNLLAVITALALGAGLAVVANGVALAMLERRREIALLKAIGFGPGHVLRFVLLENALAGTLAGSMSVVTVASALSILSRIALDRQIGFDPGVATLVLILATLLAVGTAYLAARTPVRVRPIEALRNE